MESIAIRKPAWKVISLKDFEIGLEVRYFVAALDFSAP
jgi:hypothetical protein